MAMLFELLAPKGTLSGEQRRRLGERIVTEVISADGAPEEVIERGRAISWLVIHEPDVLTIGGREVDPTEPPRYMMRVSVPGGHLNDGMRAELVARITRVLSEIDDEPQRLYREPHAWIHIVELPDGNIGAFGQVMKTSDIMRLVVNGNMPDEARPADEPSQDTAIDPICGMTVALTDTVITLDYDGTTYAFCSTACRAIFAEREAVANGT